MKLALREVSTQRASMELCVGGLASAAASSAAHLSWRAKLPTQLSATVEAGSCQGRRRSAVVAVRAKGGDTTFHKLLDDNAFVVMPGCYDALSAVVIEKSGFLAGFISGYATSASKLGKPDFGLLT